MRPMDPEPFRRRPWHRPASWLTAAWMIGVVLVSGSDPQHKLFDYIFIVPLASWIVAIIIDRILSR